MPNVSKCPVCAALLELPEGVAEGDHLVCPVCRQEFLLLEMSQLDVEDLPQAIAVESASGAESILDAEPQGGSSMGQGMIVRGGGEAIAEATTETTAAPIHERPDSQQQASAAPVDEDEEEGAGLDTISVGETVPAMAKDSGPKETGPKESAAPSESAEEEGVLDVGAAPEDGEAAAILSRGHAEDDFSPQLAAADRAAGEYWTSFAAELRRREEVWIRAQGGAPVPSAPADDTASTSSSATPSSSAASTLAPSTADVVRQPALHDEERSDYDIAPGQTHAPTGYDRSDLEIPDPPAPAVAVSSGETAKASAADRARAARKPSGKSAVRMLFEVIMGGVLAVVIVEAILTWGLKKPGPFGLYKHLPAEYLPENLRPRDAAD